MRDLTENIEEKKIILASNGIGTHDLDTIRRVLNFCAATAGQPGIQTHNFAVMWLAESAPEREVLSSNPAPS